MSDSLQFFTMLRINFCERLTFFCQCIIINHGNGRKTLYGHTSKLLVQAGEKVFKGQPIALVGNTGNSFGAHLHFEVIENGTHVDPLNYVTP